MNYKELTEEANNAAVLPTPYLAEWHVAYTFSDNRGSTGHGSMVRYSLRIDAEALLDMREWLIEKNDDHKEVIITTWTKLDPSEEQEKCL